MFVLQNLILSHKCAVMYLYVYAFMYACACVCVRVRTLNTDPEDTLEGALAQVHLEIVKTRLFVVWVPTALQIAVYLPRVSTLSTCVHLQYANKHSVRKYGGMHVSSLRECMLAWPVTPSSSHWGIGRSSGI